MDLGMYAIKLPWLYIGTYIIADTRTSRFRLNPIYLTYIVRLLDRRVIRYAHSSVCSSTSVYQYQQQGDREIGG